MPLPVMSRDSMYLLREYALCRARAAVDTSQVRPPPSNADYFAALFRLIYTGERNDNIVSLG